MKKSFLLVLLVSVVVLAAPKKVVSFRLKKDPAHKAKVYCLEASEDGMEIEYLGTRKKAFVGWSDIVESDAKRLRIKFKLELTEDEKKGLIPGHEIWFKGGVSVRGILERKDEDKNVMFVRTDGMILPYPLDRLDRVEKVKIQEAEAYNEDEIYVMRLEQRPPTNWGDHRRLANYLYEIGNYRKAKEHYEEAVRLRPELRPKVDPILAEIKDILDDEEALGTIQKAKALANLWGRYSEAIDLLEQYAAARPGAKRRIALVLDEIDAVRIRKLTVRYHRVKTREADRAIKNYLLKKSPTLEEARSWIASGFKEELQKRIERRMSLESEELEGLSKTKATGAAHWASYGGGSFVVSPTAKRGKSTGKDVRGDPESWWRRYGDVQSRSTWLKAYAAEQLPELFEVVTIRESKCQKCGGRGVVDKSSVKGLKALGGGHNWKETCPRCYGARVDRGIGYR
ncbi:MAG: hypothetical protein AAGD14_05030 [Planctomycetota bacterium]